MGNQKSQYWQYEKEWRYKISAFSRTGGYLSSVRMRDEECFEAVFVPLLKNMEFLKLSFVPLVFFVTVAGFLFTFMGTFVGTEDSIKLLTL